MADTLGSIKSEVLGWLRGDYGLDTDVALVNSSINDAVESIWGSMMQVQLARFFGLDSPVSFTLPSGAERVQLVSIADPLTPITAAALNLGALAARTYYITYTYVTESGSETLPAPALVFALNNNQLCQVIPPAPVAQAIGWNCYVSVSNTASLAGLQNLMPLPFGSGNVFTEPQAGFVDYPGAQQQPGIVQAASQATPGSSPVPSENTTADNIAWLTHLEVRTSDTLLRSWNQYDIDSELFRRYGRELSSASEYQTYVWDLINGNRLEIRPSAGMQFTPRYFYIAKPRRLRYDQANIPYVNIAGVHEFVVNEALSRLKLGIDEYLSAEAYSGRSAKGRAEILAGLTQELWGKNNRVTPHLF